MKLLLSVLLVLIPAAASGQVVTNIYANGAASTAGTVARSGVAVSTGDACVVGITATDETVTISSLLDGTHTYTSVMGPVDAATGTARLWVYRTFAMTAGTYTITATFSATPATSTIGVVCYSKSSGTWAMDGADSKTDNASATSILFDPLTTTSASGVVIGFAGYPSARATSAGGLFTTRITNTTRIGVVDLATTGTGTYTPEATVPSAVNSVTVTLALRTTSAQDPATVKRFIVRRGGGL